MLIYGFHSVLARIRRAPASVQNLYVAGERDDARVRDLLKLAQAAGVKSHLVDHARVERLCPHKRHQGVVAVVEKLKGHPLFAHITLTRSERSPIAALVTEMLEDIQL